MSFLLRNAGLNIEIPLSIKKSNILYFQCRFFGNDKLIKNRIKAVKSVEKITKAMKMVASSKLRAKELHKHNGDVFCSPIISLYENFQNQIFQSNTLNNKTEKNLDSLVLCLSSDKGLCGSVNSAVIKNVISFIKQSEQQQCKTEVIAVGSKVRSSLVKNESKKLISSYVNTSRYPVSFRFASLLAEEMINHSADNNVIIFNEFKSMLAYSTKCWKLLSESEFKQVSQKISQEYMCEPGSQELFHSLYQFYLATSIYKCLLNNDVSEQSSRRLSMDNASKNARDIMNALTLKYNKSRQSKITMELMEIISGANSVE